jgi:hypothetical protein
MKISLSHVTLSPNTSTRGSGAVVAARLVGAACAAEVAKLGMAMPASSAHVSRSRHTVRMKSPRCPGDRRTALFYLVKVLSGRGSGKLVDPPTVENRARSLELRTKALKLAGPAAAL